MVAEMSLPKFGDQWAYYQEWVEPLQRAVLNMQRRGLWLNKPVLYSYKRELKAELKETDDIIRGIADSIGFKYTDKFPNSDQQVAKFLFSPEYIGLLAFKKTKKIKRLERYINKLESDPDGRVRPRVKMTGTKTFRYAYEEPPLQQYPDEVRKVFWAKEGHVYVSVDYKALEARILAVLAGDEPSLEVFRRGGDVHAYNAGDLFGWTDEEREALEPKRRKAARNYAKGFLYRISYGGEGATDKAKVFCPCPKCESKVPQTLTLKKAEILATEQRWFAKHPAVKEFQRQTLAFIKQNRYYLSPLGVRRFVAATWGAELERELKNLPMQMNAALLMNRGQVALDRGWSVIGGHLGAYSQAPICLQMHDAFLLEVPEGAKAEYWAARVQCVMERPVPELSGTSFPTEVSIGRNWGDWSEDNPEGLKEVR
jgi:DNA polymerase-1